MFLLKDCIRHSFAQKKLGKRMVGAITINTIRHFFNDPKLEGYVGFSILYIKTTNQQIKIQAFQKKQALIQEINARLQSVGYTTQVKDIRIK